MAFLYKLLPIFFLLLSHIVTIQAVNIEFIRRDSPRSPFYNASQSQFDRLQSLFQRSIDRVSTLQMLTSVGKMSTPQKDIQSSVSRNGGEYLMKMALGTPPVEFLAIADTGSDLTWTQCKPCTNCYKQTSPLFDPMKSSTYGTASCRSQECSVLGSSASCGKAKACTYRYSYVDRSYTVGQLSTETLTFDSNSSFPKFLFGCGHENTGTFSEAGAGLVGLGNGKLSIVNQLAKPVGGRFSYCLALVGSNATSTISFGPDASVVGRGVVSTSLVKDKSPDTFYYLTLEGVSVGNCSGSRRQQGSSKASVEEGNIIIDSGTTLSYLPSDIYEGLESDLVASVKGTRVSSPQKPFILCYNKSSDFRAPAVIAHFRGADVELARESAFLEVAEGVMCFTAVPSDNSDNLAIFGNMHQMNYKIGYDVEGGKVDFLATDCSKSS